jgi:transforming growth factor-beta-induced protein
MKTLNGTFKMKTRSLALAGMIMFSVLAISCNKTSDDTFATMDPVLGTQDIPATLQTISGNAKYFTEADGSMKAGRKVPTFGVLMSALEKTGLTSTVAKNRFTVFAPSDEAFANLFSALGVSGIQDLTAEQLTPILLYHVVENPVFSSQLKNGFVPTVNGAAVEVKLNGGVMINDASVIRADLKALNGALHVVDKVLLPPTKNIVEIAQSIPQFSILVQAVVKAGLVDALSANGSMTVFAPTNDAFVALLAELGASSLNDVPVDVLTNVLLYHVVGSRVYSSDLPAGPLTVQTLLSGKTFSINAATLKITDLNNREAGLVPALLNVQATNGVIHVIDRVILPN